jgi:hypothetical protein
MRSSYAKPVLWAATIILGSGLIAGCTTTYTLEEAQLEEQAEAALAPQFEGEAPTIDCPGDVTAEVGATATCTASLGGETATALITITSVDDEGQVEFDVEIQ